jgi:steroid 5-alpha reductase family enzyme
MNKYLLIVFAHVVFLHFFYFWALKKKDYSIIDVGGVLGASLMALVTVLQFEQIDLRSFLVAYLTLVWGIRLSLYLYDRSLTKGEHYQYRQLRESWGSNADKMAYRKILWVQILVGLLVYSPVPLIIFNSHLSLGTMDYVGLIIWAIGFTIESLSDGQKTRFQRTPGNAGVKPNIGFWKYLRRPNYVGEIILWWGVFFLSLNTTVSGVAWIGPVTLMVWLWFKVKKRSVINIG